MHELARPTRSRMRATPWESISVNSGGAGGGCPLNPKPWVMFVRISHGDSQGFQGLLCLVLWGFVGLFFVKGWDEEFLHLGTE